MAVPYTFGSATTSIPLSQLDSNFATTITLGNTAIQLGNTVTTLNNMTLASPTLTTPALGTPASGVMTNVTAIPAAQITGSQAIPKSTLPTGTVLQVVQGTTSSSTSTSSATPVATSLTATITPTSATSKVLVMYSTVQYINVAGNQAFYFIYKNGSVIGLGNYRYGNVYGFSPMVSMINNSYLDSPATTSSTTYTIYLASAAGTVINGDSAMNQTITLMEISA